MKIIEAYDSGKWYEPTMSDHLSRVGIRFINKDEIEDALLEFYDNYRIMSSEIKSIKDRTRGYAQYEIKISLHIQSLMIDQIKKSLSSVLRKLHNLLSVTASYKIENRPGGYIIIINIDNSQLEKSE